MAILAITALTAKKYVPLSEQDSEVDANELTSFDLKPLNGLEYMEVISELKTDSEGVSRLSGEGLKKSIRYGLVGWDNFNDEQGRKVKFNKFNVSKVPPLVLAELASEIINVSETGNEERKN